MIKGVIEMLTIKDFQISQEHPWGMLDGYKNAMEKEAVLQSILSQCVEQKDLKTAGFTIYRHPAMVKDDLLEEVKIGYKLTVKSLGLLYSVYGKQYT